MYTYNGATILALLTDLLDGRVMGDDKFYRLVNQAKNNREAKRPWRILIKCDSTKTSLTSDNYLTAKALPTDFRKTLKTNTLKLSATGGVVYNLVEVPFEQRLEYQNSWGYFYIDYAGGNFYICGTPPTALTCNLFYISKSADITSTTSWVFPDEYAPILAFDVAMMQKGGIDYDDINARMVTNHGQSAADMASDMDFWDASLWQSAIGV